MLGYHRGIEGECDVKNVFSDGYEMISSAWVKFVMKRVENSDVFWVGYGRFVTEQGLDCCMSWRSPVRIGRAM